MEVVINHWFRKIGFRFDAMAAFLLCQEKGIDLNEIDTLNGQELILGWTYNAHVSYMMIRYRKPLSYKKYVHIRGKLLASKWEKVLKTMQESSVGDEKKKVSL